MGDLTKNFSSKEFVCRCGCGTLKRNQDFLARLQQLRETVKMPVEVKSGTRCVLHNIEVGGSENSSHISGKAADIACKDMKLLLTRALMMFPRVGIGPDMAYVHVDTDENKKQNIYWTY